ncbi:uncharacterized protein LOC103101122 [Monodelphis domestica]|uniref:uncharacterized protein LOC103101122 n=1 Tax=Monodelphis domestica TaxID=13616 RepID=UPI0024E20442|nr:uncharacterized protein LOC103101122 [Monodelphis domestica]
MVAASQPGVRLASPPPRPCAPPPARCRDRSRRPGRGQPQRRPSGAGTYLTYGGDEGRGLARSSDPCSSRLGRRIEERRRGDGGCCSGAGSRGLTRLHRRAHARTLTHTLTNTRARASPRGVRPPPRLPRSHRLGPLPLEEGPTVERSRPDPPRQPAGVGRAFPLAQATVWFSASRSLASGRKPFATIIGPGGVGDLRPPSVNQATLRPCSSQLCSLSWHSVAHTPPASFLGWSQVAGAPASKRSWLGERIYYLETPDTNSLYLGSVYTCSIPHLPASLGDPGNNLHANLSLEPNIPGEGRRDDRVVVSTMDESAQVLAEEKEDHIIPPLPPSPLPTLVAQ